MTELAARCPVDRESNFPRRLPLPLEDLTCIRNANARGIAQ